MPEFNMLGVYNHPTERDTIHLCPVIWLPHLQFCALCQWGIGSRTGFLVYCGFKNYQLKSLQTHQVGEALDFMACSFLNGYWSVDSKVLFF